MVVVKHTHGEGVRFHPHLHTLPAAGGWDEERAWRPLPSCNHSVLRELFQIEVFRFLRERELLSRERMEMILSPKPFGV
ncbi:MAG: transposase [Candidatus Krumholzibacteriota bacterium]|nr:transposase [Candidatus Krumholzibacteriota bacterium]